MAASSPVRARTTRSRVDSASTNTTSRIGDLARATSAGFIHMAKAARKDASGANHTCRSLGPRLATGWSGLGLRVATRHNMTNGRKRAIEHMFEIDAAIVNRRWAPEGPDLSFTEACGWARLRNLRCSRTARAPLIGRGVARSRQTVPMRIVGVRGVKP